MEEKEIMNKGVEIAVALKNAHQESYLFEYLDWCQAQELTYKQTLDFDTAMRFGWEMHNNGIDLNGLQIAELYER